MKSLVLFIWNCGGGGLPHKFWFFGSLCIDKFENPWLKNKHLHYACLFLWYPSISNISTWSLVANRRCCLAGTLCTVSCTTVDVVTASANGIEKLSHGSKQRIIPRMLFSSILGRWALMVNELGVYKPERHVAVATDFFVTVAPDVSVSSVWNLLHFTLRGGR
jgi:hypothetical protein